MRERLTRGNYYYNAESREGQCDLTIMKSMVSSPQTTLT
jgi:hypothetical protein